MIIDINKESQRLKLIMEGYLIKTSYFVYEIDFEDLIIYIDSIDFYGKKNIRTTYIPFYLEDYKICIYQ